jgi:hypothetical protein
MIVDLLDLEAEQPNLLISLSSPWPNRVGFVLNIR